MLIIIVIAIFVFTGCVTPDIEKLNANQNVKGLIKALEYDDSERMFVVGGAKDTLIEIGPQAVELLIDTLKNHKNPKIIMTAAELLGKIGDLRAVEPLITALDKEDTYFFCCPSTRPYWGQASNSTIITNDGLHYDVAIGHWP